MNLLADTNVFIDYWRASDEAKAIFRRLVETNAVIVCGVVRAELLHGSRSDKNRIEIHRTLSGFDTLYLKDFDWEVLGDQLYQYRTHGLTIPLADAMIACTSLIYDIPVWTNDKHFDRMKSILPELKVVRTEDLLA